jgi:4a-hydroxytetrahydrobiopterin dehydratase
LVDIPIKWNIGIYCIEYKAYYPFHEEKQGAKHKGGGNMSTSSQLAAKKCVPCAEGVPPLKGEKLQILFKELGNNWKLINDHHLEKEYTFPDFRKALSFTNRVGELAEKEGHHPDIHLAWGKVKLEIWTHKINGLSESDFILAAKCDIEHKNLR